MTENRDATQAVLAARDALTDDQRRELDAMTRRFDPSADTYWCPREQDDSLSRYFRQF